MDLSNVSDASYHDLLLAKLKAYDFPKNTLTLMCSYLKNCKQNVVVNNSASLTQGIIVGFMQGVR